MGALRAAINLTIGKSAFPYQDVMSMNLIQLKRYSIPSTRGSHSEISGT
jgi:hypothetical protein